MYELSGGLRKENLEFAAKWHSKLWLRPSCVRFVLVSLVAAIARSVAERAESELSSSLTVHQASATIQR